MRSFQLIALLLFIGVYILIFLFAWKNFSKILGVNKKLTIIFFLFNGLVLSGLFFLYIYPLRARGASYYPLYFFYNIFLLSTFIFNLPMAIGWIVQQTLKNQIKQPVISWSGFILALSLTVGMIYGTVAGSRQINIKHIELTFPNLPPRFSEFRIVQFSDLHLGGMLKPEKMLKKAARKIALTEPDLIVFTGDLVNNFARETNDLISGMQEISGLARVYSILGNHDYGDYTDWESSAKKQANFKAILKAHQNAGFLLLNNEHEILYRGTDSIFLVGVENWGHPPFPQYADLEAAAGDIPAGAFTILLTHDPAHWEEKVAGIEEIELTLSGHTHGFQWGIKLAGIPFSPAWFTRHSWGGLYKNKSSVLYVNTGLGTVGMPWRLDMPGEITVFTLKRGEID